MIKANVAPFTPQVSYKPYRLCCFIDMLPDLQLNGPHGHWAVKAKKVKAIKTIVFLRVASFRPKEPLTKAKLTLIRHSLREPDYDNLVASFKPVIDALKDAGIIVNDTTKVIGQSDYQWLKCSKPNQGIQIIIEEREASDRSNGSGREH